MKVNINKLIIVASIVSVLHGQSYMGSAAFLKRGVSARAIGMGLAYTAQVDDPSASFWNPAGLLNTKGFQIQLSDSQDGLSNFKAFGDVNNPQFGLSYFFRKPLLSNIYWAVGLAASGYFVKGIDEYDYESNFIGSFNYGEYVVFFSTAFKVRIFKLGITWKFIEQNIAVIDRFIQNNKESLMKKPHDFGIMFNPTKYLTIGMVIRDSIRVGIYDYYPRSSQLGVKFDLNNIESISLPHIIIATDVIVIENSSNKVNMGCEYKHLFKNNISLAVRMGLSNLLFSIDENVNYLDKIYSINKKGSVGLGIEKNKWRFDIAVQQEVIRNPYSRITVFTINRRL